MNDHPNLNELKATMSKLNMENATRMEAIFVGILRYLLTRLKAHIVVRILSVTM